MPQLLTATIENGWKEFCISIIRRSAVLTDLSKDKMALKVIENDSLTSTTEFYFKNETSFPLWAITSLFDYKILTILELSICFIGIILNCFTFDVARNLPLQTSGSKWIQYLAFWDNSIVVRIFLRTLAADIFASEITNIGNNMCKFVAYTWWVCTINASGHLVCLGIDRALSIKFPRWHFRQNWLNIIPRVSLGVTLFHCLVCLPALFFLELDDNICAMRARNYSILLIYKIALVTIFSSVGHFILVSIASCVFTKKLKKHRGKRCRRSQRRANSNSGHSKKLEKDTKKSKNENDKTQNGENVEVVVVSSGIFQSSEFFGNSVFCGSEPSASHGTLRSPALVKESKFISHEGRQNKDLVSNISESNRKSAASTVKQSNSRKNSSNNGNWNDITVDKNTSRMNGNKDQTKLNAHLSGLNSQSNDSNNLERRNVSNIYSEIANSVPKNSTNASPELSDEDLKVLRTVQLVCLWYLLVMWSATVLYITGEMISDKSSPVHTLVIRLGRICADANSAFNFLFFLRGQSFRRAFVQRWVPRKPGLSSHRYSVIFSADSEIFAFSAMFRAEPADFNFDISDHN